MHKGMWCVFVAIILLSKTAASQPAGAAVPVAPLTPPAYCTQYGYTVFDMVEWIVQAYPGASSSYLGQQTNSQGPISDFSHWIEADRRFYRITDVWGSNEVYDYDDQFIYLRRETRYQNPTDFYLYPYYIWAPRYAATANSPQHQACSNYSFTREATEYVGCTVIGQLGSVRFLVAVSGPFSLTLGGDVGTVQALRLRSTNLNNFESENYWYAKPYGFVFYQKVDSGGNVLVEETHNRIYSGEPPLYLQCGIGY